MDNNYIERLKEIFESIIESGTRYDGSIDNISYYDLFCKAASQEQLYKFMGNDLCMFNCTHNNKDAIIMIFYIPINSEEYGVKNVAEKVIKIVGILEESFITMDYLKSQEIKEDKFIYVVGIKNI